MLYFISTDNNSLKLLIWSSRKPINYTTLAHKYSYPFSLYLQIGWALVVTVLFADWKMTRTGGTPSSNFCSVSSLRTQVTAISTYMSSVLQPASLWIGVASAVALSLALAGSYIMAWKKMGKLPFITSRTSKPLYCYSIFLIIDYNVRVLDEPRTSQRSQRETSTPSSSLVLVTSPGSPACMRGTAKLRKILRNSSFLQPLSTLTSSRAYRPAIEEVVVAIAGTMRPAFNLTVSQSIGSRT